MKFRHVVQRGAPLVAFCASLVFWLGGNADLFAQAWPDYQMEGATDEHDIVRSTGGYLSWYKLLLIAMAFIIWIRVADWMNRDSIEMHGDTAMPPQIVNPLNLMIFFFGFLMVITVPYFFLGYPLYLLTTFLPLIVYVLMRNSRVVPEDRAFTGAWMGQAWKGEFYKERNIRRSKTEGGPEMEFKAAGANEEAQQSNLIRARQMEQFAAVKQMLYDSIAKRAGSILMDYSPEAARIRMEVDGFWHEIATVNRPTGDQMLYSLKSLAALNPNERRAVQSGRFTAIIDTKKTPIEITCQGVPNGERVTMKMDLAYASRMTPQQIGMWPEVAEATIDRLNSPGIVVISGTAGSGLSTTWTNLLTSADRLTRDCVSLVDAEETETTMENIQRKEVVVNGKGNIAELESLVLRNPDVIILPSLVEPPQFVDIGIREVNKNERAFILRVNANSAAEAILRVMQKVTDHEGLIKGLTLLTCQRLVRRLCKNCKQPLQANPQLVAQLGGKPGDEVNLCGPYQKPSPPPVDEKGNPIDIPDCHVCGGLGYIGRIAVVEALIIDDKIRKALLAKPKLEVINEIARKQGNLTMLQQGYRLVLAGVTSLQEVQRIFQKKK